MRLLILSILVTGTLVAQQGASKEPAPALTTSPHPSIHELTIPAGTQVPIRLENAISTKTSRPGEAVYARTTFPVAVDDKILIPAGTYVQGKIAQIKPAGRLKGRAEVLLHFTTLIYPSGYTVMLPGSIENAPGVDKAHVKDKEGTIQADSNKGKTAATIAQPAGQGALVGALARGGEGALIGAGIGGAIGTTIAALSHGNEITFHPGTTLEVVIQREVQIDASRIHSSARSFDEE
jgi:type IV secretion system protein VirB10